MHQGVFSKSAGRRENCVAKTTHLDCAGKAQRRQRFRVVNQSATCFQSGVALRLPPQSKISHFENMH
jgi:hypothetical protein